MLSDNVQFDINTDFEDSNYKSCFARSVVVNSQYQQSKNFNQQQRQLPKEITREGIVTNNMGEHLEQESAAFSKMRRVNSLTENHIKMTASDSRRSSACSSRIAEMPVENLVLKSQIETLQWQLKQTEASKEMYRAVMVQVVKFLERAHRSLQMLGSKLNTAPQAVSKAQIDHQASRINDNSYEIARTNIPNTDASNDYTAFRDYTWRRQKKAQSITDEIPPEKLSQEAFRLLRTAQSLLNTRAPDLAHLNDDTSEDLKFLEQLAKEFPRIQDNGTHRPESRCSSLQLASPDKDIRIATALNRKLSLQRTSAEFKRNSFHLELPRTSKSFDLSSNSEFCLLSSTLNDSEYHGRNKNHRFKQDPEKSNSPPMSSVSSAEDESGFSSMNSFQELGIPLINSTTVEEQTNKEATLNNNLHSDASICPVTDKKPPKSNDFKLWQRPEGVAPLATHKRWSSNPVDSKPLTEKPLKVLWV